MGAQWNYTRGLHDLGNGCHAYLQPEGGWGWSNAGLIVGDGGSLLVDTLFDLRLTAEMLDAMTPVTTTAPIATVVNTHGNGDHCYGNELVADAEILATVAAAREMAEVPPELLGALCEADGELGELFREFFGEFDFSAITPTPPTRTFRGRLDLDVAGRRVELIEVGPAHTQGDAVVVVADARVVFTGDIVFAGSTPVVWAGPVSRWIDACDLILGLDIDVVVPGHGPLADKSTVVEMRDHLVFVAQEARERFEAGIDAFEAARDIARELGTGRRELGRVGVNVETVYRELDPGHRSPDLVEQFRRMARLEREFSR